MRPLTIIALAACVGLLASQFYATAAPPPKPPDPVEVVNFPDPQNVTGSLVCEPAARIELVGFTSQLMTGDLGGPFGALLLCQAEFPESRLCTDTEAQQTLNLPSGLSGSAWLGPATGSGCDQFTLGDNANASAQTVFANGTRKGRPCNTLNFVACCALVP